MCCSDCKYRQKNICLVFDDVILSLSNSCFMDSEKRDEVK